MSTSTLPCGHPSSCDPAHDDPNPGATHFCGRCAALASAKAELDLQGWVRGSPTKPGVYRVVNGGGWATQGTVVVVRRDFRSVPPDTRTTLEQMESTFEARRERSAMIAALPLEVLRAACLGDQDREWHPLAHFSIDAHKRIDIEPWAPDEAFGALRCAAP